jgi:CPA1 family monovalent cation:H+ antiporter
MELVEILLAGMLAMAVLATVARKVGIAYPVLLVLGGLVLGLVPGLPAFHPEPDIIFLVFLPPLVYIAASTTAFRDLRFNLRPILFLSVGLVFFSVLVVAGVAYEIAAGLGWPAAFVLATIVAPTDTVAVTAITHRLSLPRRIVTILEGESLINDAAALVAYRTAVTLVRTGAEFSAGEALWFFVRASVGGLVIGVVAGRISVWVRRRLEDPAVSLTVSLLTPFFAYLPAEAVGVSGILATVAAGLIVGRHLPEILDAETRVQGFLFWEMLVFLLNGLAFILIGLQLRTIVGELNEYSPARLFGYAAAVSGAVILARIIWVFPATYLPRLLIRSLREHDPAPSWRMVSLVAWSGMRGVDSLAAALALPLVVANGEPFPQRNLLLFLSFAVILATLVVQGLTLPWLIRWLGVADSGVAEIEENQARYAAARAALEKLELLAPRSGVPPVVLDQLREFYGHQADRYLARFDPHDDGAREDHVSAVHRLKRNLLDVQRAQIVKLRNREAISDDVLRRIERDLDLEELRLEA